MSNWISVEERLPEKPETPFHSYLCWGHRPRGEVKSGIAFDAQFSRDTGTFLQRKTVFAPLVITHWQPLPEPPEAS